MECLHKLTGMGTQKTSFVRYNREKIERIREKIKVVFGSDSTMDDVALSEKYNITSDGDLIMILR